MTVADDAHDAADALAAITRQAAVLHVELQRAVAIFVDGAPYGELADVASEPVDAAVLELTVDGWRHLVPTERAARRAFAALVFERFGDTLRSFPLVLGAIGRRDLATGDADGAASDDGTDRAALARALERVDLAAGTTLFTQGDPGDSLYVIVRGRLRLVVTDAGSDALVRELGPGQTVGELALLTGDPRNGTVVAIRDAVVYRLGKDEFERTGRSHPDVTRTMLATLAGRLNHPAPGAVHSAPQNIAVISVGVGGCGRELAEALAVTMNREVPTALVTSASVDAAVGDGAVDADPASPLGVRVQHHLGELEERHRHLLLLADEAVTPWSLKCVREADLVLLVGRAGAAPLVTDLEEAVFEAARPAIGARRHLVVVEPTATGIPTGTDRWLRTRAVDRCHHVHLASPDHLGRLARFVTGTPVGLALSGGAVRAFAHLGVLRALRAAGIPVDVIVATSAGAVVGAQLAMGLDPDRIIEHDRQAFGALGRMLLDLVPPFTSLFGGTRFNAVLDDLFGDVCFEDLWLQFACTTTDLTAAQPRLHRHGRLRPFIRASCSLPMLFPPVIHEGHLLADGGIVNNLPVDPLLGMGHVGFLVAVNVATAFYDADEAYNYEDSLPLARVLNGRLNPFAERLVAPGMLDVLMRSLEIGSKSVEPAQAAKADLYIRPDVSRFGYTDVGAIAAIVAAGEAATVARLAEVGAPVVAFTR